MQLRNLKQDKWVKSLCGGYILYKKNNDNSNKVICEQIYEENKKDIREIKKYFRQKKLLVQKP